MILDTDDLSVAIPFFAAIADDAMLAAHTIWTDATKGYSN